MDDQAHSGDEHAAERLRALIETIPATTYVCEWDEQATIRYISPQVEQLLGYPPAAWLGDQDLWHRRVHEDDREAMIAEERRAFHAEKPFDMEYRMVAA